jgi:hypothetical protein
MAGTHITITADEVEALAQKLDAFGEQLNEKERATLLSVMSLAGSAIEEKAGDSEVDTFASGFTLGTFPSVPSTSFGNGFRSAFTPLTPGGFRPGGTQDVSDSVGVTGSIMF